MKLTAADLDRQIADKTPVPLDTNLLLASGAMAGPDRPVLPVTLTWWMRVRRLLKGTA